MKRLYFINRFYYPDLSSTSQLLTDLAEVLSKNNFDVHIIASSQLYEDPKARLEKDEVINGVHVHRLRTTRFGRANLWGRGLDYISFYISLLFYVLANTKKDDVLVAKTDPPLISVIIAFIAIFKKIKLVNWIQDLFPEVAKELSNDSFNNLLFLCLKRLRDWSLQAAKMNIVIGQIMKQRLIDNGIDINKITVINNWHIGTGDRAKKEEINELRQSWGLNNKFVVGYSGNLGRAHDYLIFLKAARIIKDRKDIVFLFIGGGTGMNELKAKVKAEGLGNFVFKDYQPRSILNISLAVPDIHLISLKPSMEGLIFPSKFYGIVASSRPIGFIGSLDGEISRLIEKSKLSFCVGSDDENTLVKRIIGVMSEYNNLGSSIIEARCIEEYPKSVKLDIELWKNILQQTG